MGAERAAGRTKNKQDAYHYIKGRPRQPKESTENAKWGAAIKRRTVEMATLSMWQTIHLAGRKRERSTCSEPQKKTRSNAYRENNTP